MYIPPTVLSLLLLNYSVRMGGGYDEENGSAPFSVYHFSGAVLLYTRPLLALQACVLHDVCTLGTTHRCWGLVFVGAPFPEWLFGKFPCTPLRKGIRGVWSSVLLEAFEHHQAVATFIWEAEKPGKLTTLMGKRSWGSSCVGSCASLCQLPS